MGNGPWGSYLTVELHKVRIENVWCTKYSERNMNKEDERNDSYAQASGRNRSNSPSRMGYWAGGLTGSFAPTVAITRTAPKGPQEEKDHAGSKRARVHSTSA